VASSQNTPHTQTNAFLLANKQTNKQTHTQSVAIMPVLKYESHQSTSSVNHTHSQYKSSTPLLHIK